MLLNDRLFLSKKPPSAVRAAPELIREDQKEQSGKKAQREKKEKRKQSVTPHTFCASAHPPTHAQKEWGELILSFVTKS